MRVAFMGTPYLAARVLDGLAQRHEVAMVVTRPDAISGRGSKLRPSAVKEYALQAGIPVIEASKMDDSVFESLKEANLEAICVAAFGCLLPERILDLPEYGCLNVHMSLLPRWRGAAPIERAMLDGDEQVGFSIMRMELGLDAGPYCMQGSIAADGRYLDDIEEELAEEGAKALSDALDALCCGGVEWVEQDDAAVCYADKIGKADMALDPMHTVEQNCARVRASSEAHPSRTRIAGRDVTVERACVADEAGIPEKVREAQPGTACFANKRLLLVCSDGVLEIEQLKPSGKKSMDARAFCAGIQNFKNESKQWGNIA